MRLRRWIAFASLLVLGGVAAILPACDDADATTSSTSGTSTSASTGASSTSSSTSTGAGGAPPTRAPGMTDLSVLFPLPASAAGLDGLLGPKDVGAYGELLPYELFSKLPQLSFFESNKSKAYDSLRVVGARLDPCFPKLAPGALCRAQVRLVLQPFETATGFAAIDAAVHLFFDLPEDDFTTLLGATTSAQSAADATGPLRVHPTMASEGLDGPAATLIKKAILARAGEGRLSRITFMQLGGQGNVWIFGGFDVQGGTTTELPIAGSPETEQTLENNAFPDPLDFHGEAFPAIPPDDLGALYESDVAKTMSEAALFPLYESALRAQNPNLHTPESVACATCHAANSAEKWVERNTGLGAMPSSARFTSTTQDLTPPSDRFDTHSQTVRAFGYQDLVPVVSQRTIFETALLVDHFQGLANP